MVLEVYGFARALPVINSMNRHGSNNVRLVNVIDGIFWPALMNTQPCDTSTSHVKRLQSSIVKFDILSTLNGKACRIPGHFLVIAFL